jgi:hypothetical protein
MRNIDLQPYLVQLARSAEALRALSQGITAEAARWRPAVEKWSMVEVVAHLGDEEVSDFGARLERLLRDPLEAWPPIDPAGWCRERRYVERELGAEVERFLSARARSIEWLSGVRSIDGERAHQHPKLGPLRAGDLLSSWIAHDLLHLRQLTGLHFAWNARELAPYSTAYAGSW